MCFRLYIQISVLRSCPIFPPWSTVNWKIKQTLPSPDCSFSQCSITETESKLRQYLKMHLLFRIPTSIAPFRSSARSCIQNDFSCMEYWKADLGNASCDGTAAAVVLQLLVLLLLFLNYGYSLSSYWCN